MPLRISGRQVPPAASSCMGQAWSSPFCFFFNLSCECTCNQKPENQQHLKFFPHRVTKDEAETPSSPRSHHSKCQLMQESSSGKGSQRGALKGALVTGYSLPWILPLYHRLCSWSRLEYMCHLPAVFRLLSLHMVCRTSFFLFPCFFKMNFSHEAGVPEGGRRLAPSRECDSAISKSSGTEQFSAHLEKLCWFVLVKMLHGPS